MLLSREIDIKLCQSQRSLRIRNLVLLLFLVIFIKDIIYNIIYMFLSRDKNSHQWQSSLLVTLYRRSHVILILHCHWWEFWSHGKDVFIILSIISVKNEKLLNSNNNRSNLSFLGSFRILLF